MKNYTISLLRIIACVAVFFVHYSQRMEFTGVLRVIADIGQFGVELFFLISSYVACLSWFRYDGNPSIKKYYIKRCIRILPLYYVSVFSLLLAEKYFFSNVPADSYGLGKLRYIFLLNGIVPADGYFWSNLGITWTIPVFMMFYLLFPVMIKFANSFKNSVLFLFVCYVLCDFLSDGFFGYFQGLTYMVYFALGIVAYFSIREHKKYIAAVGALIPLVANKFLFVINNTEFYSLLFFILLLAVVDLEITSERAQRVISLLDRYTYTFYLAHGIIFCGILDKFILFPYQKSLIGIGGSILLTVLLYHLVEQPLQKLLTKILLPSNA